MGEALRNSRWSIYVQFQQHINNNTRRHPKRHAEECGDAAVLAAEPFGAPGFECGFARRAIESGERFGAEVIGLGHASVALVGCTNAPRESGKTSIEGEGRKAE